MAPHDNRNGNAKTKVKIQKFAHFFKKFGNLIFFKENAIVVFGYRLPT